MIHLTGKGTPHGSTGERSGSRPRVAFGRDLDAGEAGEQSLATAQTTSRLAGVSMLGQRLAMSGSAFADPDRSQVWFMARLRPAGYWLRAMSWRTQRIRLAAASGWSPNSCAIRPAQPPMPNCCTERLMAVATMSAVGASEGCSPEENRARQRALFMSSWVRTICVAVGISHHPVLSASRVGLWVSGRRSGPRPVVPVAGGGPDDLGRAGSPGPVYAPPPVVLSGQVIGGGVDEQLFEHRVHDVPPQPEARDRAGPAAAFRP